LNRFSSFKTRNVGMSSTTPGTAMTAMIAANSPPRPRNRRRARAYPAIESNTSRPRVTNTATTTELASQRTKSCCSSSVNAVTTQCWGIGLSGCAAASDSVLNAVPMSSRNG
jgi:hypothetical protein